MWKFTAQFMALAFLLPAASASGLTITLIDYAGATTSLRVQASVDYDQRDNVIEPTDIPWSGADHIDSPPRNLTSGVSSSTTEYDFGNSGFAIDIVDHTRLSGISTAASHGDILFTVDQDIDYLIEGIYTTLGGAGSVIESSLWDLTDDILLFDNKQESVATPSEAYVIGLEGGDLLNRLSGSLTGSLISGHVYKCSYRAAIQLAGTEPGATATGSFGLTFVPEPSTASLLALGLSGIAAGRRRKAARHQ